MWCDQDGMAVPAALNFLSHVYIFLSGHEKHVTPNDTNKCTQRPRIFCRTRNSVPLFAVKTSASYSSLLFQSTGTKLRELAASLTFSSSAESAGGHNFRNLSCRELDVMITCVFAVFGDIFPRTGACGGRDDALAQTSVVGAGGEVCVGGVGRRQPACWIY